MVIFAAFIMFALIAASAWIVDLLCVGIVSLIPALANSHGLVTGCAIGIFIIAILIIGCIIESRRRMPFDDGCE